ncbi:MAG: EAL domain-containing protein, partial [Betaproteobacteria bacterium]|nr:EAL domain-containing protein [Betaproteobacteria bacterium]
RSRRHGRRFYARLQRTLRLRGYWSGDLWSARRDGEEFPARVSISAVRDASGAVLHYVCTITDTSREREARRAAERMARYDALTELPNRPHLRELVRNAIAQSTRSGELVALIMLDLDHFALLNGAHGHQRGDLVLVALARRMRRALRPGDTVGRFAGDKFVVLMEGLGTDPSYALHRASLMAAQLRDAAAQPFELSDAYVPGLGVSIGLSLYGRDIGAADDGDVLLAQAEAALRRAKNAGRDTLRVFEPQMQAELEARAHLVEELRAGIARDQLLLHLQPQFTGDGRLIGAEALVRWAHPVRGLLYPDAFIALAEDSGMIDAVGRQVLCLGCQLLATWSEHPRLRALRLSVNVSPLQFRREDFVAEVLDAVAVAGIRPDRLELELTESMILHDLDEAMSRLERLRQQGILVSLDDFGTGASSLSYLTRLALHQLKIDKSFVRKLPESRNDAMVAQTIIMMAKGLGLEVVAEGVETAA